MKKNISLFLAYFIVFSVIRFVVDFLILRKEPQSQYFKEWGITTLIYSAFMVPVYNYLEKKKSAKKNS
jgi:prolipoprotein diacylglyceryltransferase